MPRVTVGAENAAPIEIRNTGTDFFTCSEVPTLIADLAGN